MKMENFADNEADAVKADFFSSFIILALLQQVFQLITKLKGRKVKLLLCKTLRFRLVEL